MSAETGGANGLAVVFDMDGLMLDTEPLYRRAWQAAARDFGQEIDDQLYFRLIGRSNQDAERILAEIFGEGLSRVEFRARWLERWHQAVEQDGIRKKSGLDALLEWLDDRGIPQAVATSTERVEAGFTLGHAGLESRFEVLITGDQVSAGKPAPDIFLAAARALSFAPEACIALEDSDAGVLSASSAGMRAVMVPDMKPPSDEAASRAYRVVGSLVEVRELLIGLCADQSSEVE